MADRGVAAMHFDPGYQDPCTRRFFVEEVTSCLVVVAEKAWYTVGDKDSFYVVR